jgi:thiol-disulfide isomerase/thioredoxin
MKAVVKSFRKFAPVMIYAKHLALLPLFMVTFMDSQAQHVKIVSFDQFNRVLKEHEGNAKLINFWATWCKPCVDELPYFVRASEEMKADSLEFIYVSVDFQSQHHLVETKAKQLGLKGKLLHLDAKGNDWIDLVDPQWSGAIPFTLLMLSDGRKFSHTDQFMNYEELKSFIDQSTAN